MGRSRVLGVMVAVLAAGVLVSPTAEGGTNERSTLLEKIVIPARTCGILDGPQCRPYDAATVMVGPGRPLRALQQVVPSACPEEAFEGATCGHVEVPLEWDPPTTESEEMVSINFELYTHTDPGPAEGVLLPNFGGPGSSTTINREAALGLLGGVLSTHDLLLIDERGTGGSGALACEELSLPIDIALDAYVEAVHTCAVSLGDAADDYSTGDMALDTKEVLDALGYTQADFYALSYGGMKPFAFAARFPEMVRSIVFDSPSTPSETDPFVWGQARTSAVVDMIATFCERSNTCNRDFEDPASELTGLIERVRSAPVTGSFDFFGESFSGGVDEKQLLEMMSWPLAYLTYGDLVGAAAAQADGDRRPLVWASAIINWAQSQVPPYMPEGLSIGAQTATLCADTKAQWDWIDTIQQRLASFEAARSALPADWYAPFSKEATRNHNFDFNSMLCAGWEMPSPASPLLPNNASFPDVPVITLAAEFDPFIPLEIANDTAEYFPGTSIYEIKNSFHTVLGGFQTGCVIEPITTFISTLTKPTELCEPPVFWMPARGEFYEQLSDVDLSIARIGDGTTAGRKARRTALASARAVVDTLLRSGLGQGKCLRGGTFRARFTEAAPVTFDRCVVTEGLKLTGKVFWPLDGAVSGEIKITGRRAAHGTLKVAGSYFSGAKSGRITVRGTLGGREVRLSTTSN